MVILKKKNSTFINGTKEIINTIGRDYSTITIGDISYKLKDNSSNSSEEKEYLFVILVYEKSTSLFEKTKRRTESLKNKIFLLMKAQLVHLKLEKHMQRN